METTSNFEANGACERLEAQGPATDTELLVFLDAVNKARKAYFVEQYPVTYRDTDEYENRELLAYEVGPKYIKVVRTESPAVRPEWKPREVTTVAGRVPRVCASVFCFIERSTGNILKAASYKAPAKGARGNIRDAGFWLKSVTPYGAAYLR